MCKLLLLLVAVSAAQALERLQPILETSKATVPEDHSGLRIVGGDEAAPGQFPHQVGIWIQTRSGKAFCGGSILSEHIVITAAHCAEPGLSFTIVTGAHEIAKDGTSYVTKKKLVHENYKSDGAVANDIALLYVDTPIVLNDRVKPIRLPSVSEAKSSLWRAEATMSGWGLQHTNDEQVAPTLRFLRSRVVTNMYCKARYFFQFVHETNICVSGWWAKGTCQGDSGGPMVIYEADGSPTLVGLTSFGISFGCDVSWPSVFTRVGAYLDWIEAGVKSF